MLLGRFPLVGSGWSDQSVLKWNARVLRTGSGQNDPANAPINIKPGRGGGAGKGGDLCLWPEIFVKRPWVGVEKSSN